MTSGEIKEEREQRCSLYVILLPEIYLKDIKL